MLNVASPANATIAPGDADQNPFSDAHADRYTQGVNGEPGSALALVDYTGGVTGVAHKLGIYQLYKTDIFNLLCLPGAPTEILGDLVRLEAWMPPFGGPGGSSWAWYQAHELPPGS